MNPPEDTTLLWFLMSHEKSDLLMLTIKCWFDGHLNKCWQDNALHEIKFDIMVWPIAPEASALTTRPSTVPTLSTATSGQNRIQANDWQFYYFEGPHHDVDMTMPLNCIFHVKKLGQTLLCLYPSVPSFHSSQKTWSYNNGCLWLKNQHSDDGLKVLPLFDVGFLFCGFFVFQISLFHFCSF